MDQCIQKYAEHVTGRLSGWDRIVFRGTLRMLCFVDGTMGYLARVGVLLKDFGEHAQVMTARLIAEDDGVRQALDRALPQLRAEVRADHPGLDLAVDRGEQRQAWSDGHARQERRDDPRGPARRRHDDDPAFSLDGVEPAMTTAPVRAEIRLGGTVSRTAVDALA